MRSSGKRVNSALRAGAVYPVVLDWAGVNLAMVERLPSAMRNKHTQIADKPAALFISPWRQSVPAGGHGSYLRWRLPRSRLD